MVSSQTLPLAGDDLGKRLLELAQRLDAFGKIVATDIAGIKKGNLLLRVKSERNLREALEQSPKCAKNSQNLSSSTVTNSFPSRGGRGRPSKRTDMAVLDKPPGRTRRNLPLAMDPLHASHHKIGQEQIRSD